MEINGTTFDPDLDIVIINGTVDFTTTWDIGTDINYTLDYGDDHTFFWNWVEENHTHSYRYLVTHQYHSYREMGNYTVVLNVTNELGTHVLVREVTVEPPLETYVFFNTSWAPIMTPSFVQFFINAVYSHVLPPIVMWCNYDFDDPWYSTTTGNVYGTVTLDPFVTNHTYVTDKPDASPYVVCNNHVSNITYRIFIILQQPITGLDIVPFDMQWLTFQEFPFNITMKTGSHISVNVSFGDSHIVNFKHPNRLSFEDVLKVTHIYTIDNNYTTSLTAYNNHFNQTIYPTFTVILQNQVWKLTLIAVDKLLWPPGTTDFRIVPDLGTSFPSDTFCSYKIKDDCLLTVFSTNISSGITQIDELYYERKYIGYNVTMDVFCENLASKQTFIHYIWVYEVIEGLNIESDKTAVITKEIIDFTLTVFNGSNVYYDVDFGDGNSTTLRHPNIFAVSMTMHTYHSYDHIGNYTVSVTAYNEVDKNTTLLPYKIVVQNPIVNLTLWYNESVLWPPGDIEFEIRSGDNQSPLTDMHCEWDFGGRRTMYDFIENFNQGHLYARIPSFTRSWLGMLDTSINCSNLVSHFPMKAKTDIILDAVILDSLDSNNTIYWKNISVVILNVTRFGANSCFLFNMGFQNISSFMYGLEICEQNATDLDIPFYPMAWDPPYGVIEIVHGYEYPWWGIFDVTVFAFNHVSNDTLTTKVAVMEWFCYTPNITLPDNFTDPDNPLTYMRSEDFVIVPDLMVNCMKADYVDRIWEVFDITAKVDSPPMYWQNSSLIFNHTKRTLPYGSYKIRYWVMMLDINNTDTEDWGYLTIIKTPLVVEIAGKPNVTLPYMVNYLLNAIDVTFDLDVEPDNKTGLTFKWICIQVRQ